MTASTPKPLVRRQVSMGRHRASPDSVTVGSSLFRKYVGYLIALVSIALIVSGLTGLYFTYEESKTARLNLQLEKAEAAASRIETYVREIASQLGWVRQPLADPINPERQRDEYYKLLRQIEAATEISVIDQAGREHLRVSRVDMNTETRAGDAARIAALAAAREGEPYFGNVYLHKGSEPHMAIAVAGLGTKGYVTVAQINLKFVSREVVSRIKVSPKGLAYVVDSHGLLIGHPDKSEALKDRNLVSFAHVERALRGPGDDQDRVMMSEGLSGRHALIGHAAVAPLGWHVFVEQPVSEALAPLYASLERTGLLLLAGLALAVAVSLFLARHMVMPIRAIQAGATRIAAGKLDQTLEVHTGDELEGLANEFNVMARQLKESYASLERQVDRRTHDLAEALEQQTVTSEVLKKISRSSFDLNRVLEELIKSVVQLARADAGALYLRHSDNVYALQTAHVANRALQSLTASIVPELRPGADTATGRAIATGVPVQIDDARDEPGYRWPDAGFRTALAVPILGEGAAIGVIVVLNVEKRPLGEKQIGFMTTFADQAAIAVQNAQLFNDAQDKRRQLELANRHKSEFLANVSHELRTPLNAIIGFSDVLRERMFGEINEKQAEYLQDIHTSGRHLLSLINDILDISKVEAGRMDLELRPFDVRDALQNALGLVRERANRHDIELALEVDSRVGEWVADERKFRQIMLNLLSNAVKFTGQGGEIRVRAVTSAKGLEISVVDNGIGIAADHLEMIFDEFRQVRSDNLHKDEGTGLGLPLTKRLVELHGGTVRVESVVGEGSTFSFNLPPATVEAA